MSRDDWKIGTPEDDAADEAASLRRLLGRDLDKVDVDRMREDKADYTRTPSR